MLLCLEKRVIFLNPIRAKLASSHDLPQVKISTVGGRVTVLQPCTVHALYAYARTRMSRSLRSPF